MFALLAFFTILSRAWISVAFATECDDYVEKIAGTNRVVITLPGEKPVKFAVTEGSLGRYLDRLAGLDDTVEIPSLEKFRFPQKELQRLNPENLIGKTFLDAGCGEGKAVVRLSEMGVNAVGIDLVLSKEQKEKPDLFKEKDIRDTGFPNDHFDVSLSSASVFFYSAVSNKVKMDALKELTRVTKKGGLIVLIQTLEPAKMRLFEAMGKKLGLKKIEYEPASPDDKAIPPAIVFEKE